jgi:hypothetical protein
MIHTPRRDPKLRRSADGQPLQHDLVFVCNCFNHHDSRSRWCERPVADACYALWTGALLPPGEPVRHRFVWRLLLTGKLGLLVPYPVDLAPVRDDFPEFAGARDLFALLMGLKRANGDDRPAVPAAPGGPLPVRQARGRHRRDPPAARIGRHPLGRQGPRDAALRARKLDARPDARPRGRPMSSWFRRERPSAPALPQFVRGREPLVRARAPQATRPPARHRACSARAA